MNFFQGIPLLGSIVNSLGLIAGGLVGLTLRCRVNEELMELAIKSIGLFTVAIGVQMALKMQNMLIIIFSLCVGSIIGGLIDIDGRVERCAEKIKTRFKDGGSTFTEGFMTATLMCCTGSMAVLGAFEEGLGGYPTLLLTKSMLDFLVAMALSATLGFSVIFAAVPLFLYEGMLTLAARILQSYMTEAATVEMSAVGGILLIGLGLMLLNVPKMKLMNSLPALVIAAVAARIFIG